MTSSGIGLEGIMVHFRKFNGCGRKFHNTIDLLKATERASAGDSYVSESARTGVVEYLSGEDCDLFSSSSDGEVTAADLDSVIFASHGLEGVIYHLQSFDAVKRQFDQFTEIGPAIEHAKIHQHHRDTA